MEVGGLAQGDVDDQIKQYGGEQDAEVQAVPAVFGNQRVDQLVFFPKADRYLV